MNLGEIIKDFRTKNKITMATFAEMTGLSKGYISMLEKNQNPQTGKPIAPSLETIKQVSQAMSIEIETILSLLDDDILITLNPSENHSTLSLITETSAKLNDDNQLNVLNYATHLYEDEQNSIKEPLHLYTVEVVEGLAAGNGFSYGDNETTLYYTDREDLRYYDYASLVSGDSMEPDYPDGSVALIQRGYDSLNGQVYAVDYDGKSFIKKVYNEQSHFRLVSINEKYEDIIIDVPVHEDTHFNIIGKVVDWFTPIEK